LGLRETPSVIVLERRLSGGFMNDSPD